MEIGDAVGMDDFRRFNVAASEMMRKWQSAKQIAQQVAAASMWPHLK